MNLLREYIRTLLEFSIKANRKNVHQDGTSKSRGYMSGIDKTWTGEDTNDHLHNWYKKMGLMSEALLNESVDSKIMSMIDRAEAQGLRVRINKYEVFLWDGEDDIVGRIAVDDDTMYGPCLGAYHVSHSQAAEGFGPLLYDVAIEFTGGLVPDRTQVSDEARDVWKYYDERRADVNKEQLDDMRNTLTPDEKDNCEQLSAAKDKSVQTPWKGSFDFESSSLSKKYSKSGTPVMDELRKRGMLDE